MTVAQMIMDGLKYMVIGVGIVFAVLGLFFAIIKLLQKIWPSREES